LLLFFRKEVFLLYQKDFMIVILTGATGFVGGEILRRLAARPDIEEIMCLTRRAPEALPSKANVILHDDFSVYDESVLDRLAECSACIWALGGKASDLGEQLEKVTHSFAIAFARAMTERADGDFTFCYLSGMGADSTETARFPWERATRHLKGRTERDLARLQGAHPHFCAHSFRPGGILPASTNRLVDWLLAPLVVRVGDLAEAMIIAGIEGRLFRKLPLLHNANIKRLAKGVPTT
jgi:hypothetical protein